MQVVMRDGEIVGKVGIVHWWPGRDYVPRCDFSLWINPIPSRVRRRAYKMKSNYLTMAYVSLGDGELATYAMCCHKDQPSRATGRFIALLRMARLLKSMGLRMEKA